MEIFTGKTKAGYAGQITEIVISQNSDNNVPQMLIPSGNMGPFFHIDTKKFVLDKKSKPLSINMKYCKYSRVNKLIEFIKKSKHDASKKKEIKNLILLHEYEIEMDAEFSFLHILIKYINKKDKNKFIKIYRKTPIARWMGLTEPKNFNDANLMYNLEHLRRKRKEKTLYVYKFFLDTTNKKNPISLFFGKVAGGSSFQFKFNNRAVECIIDIEIIKKIGVKNDRD